MNVYPVGSSASRVEMLDALLMPPEYIKFRGKRKKPCIECDIGFDFGTDQVQENGTWDNKKLCVLYMGRRLKRQ